VFGASLAENRVGARRSNVEVVLVNRLWLGLTGLLAIVVIAGGCTAPVRSGTYTLASTKHDASVLGSKFVLVEENAFGSASTPIIFFPFGFPRDYLVMDEVLTRYDGDLLTDIKFTSKSTVFVAFGAFQLKMTCDVWKLADRAALSGESGEHVYSLDEIQARSTGGDSYAQQLETTEVSR